MIILTTTFNCEKFIERSLYSIMSQTHKDFKCFITDDLSTDNTRTLVEKIIQKDERFSLVKNDRKFYQPGNYDQIIRGMDIHDDEICVEVDGDDWLPNSKVFETINKVYTDSDVWMTSGSFKYHDGRPGFAQPPVNSDNIRSQTFTLSHIRTWKSWLWKKISVEDLKDENGEYWNVAGDLAFMFPMFEMSGMEHYKFISEILYIYNESNPLNDHKVNMPSVMKTVNQIRAKQKYQKI
jgi:glycosyltransferase involved in cell wall biosynthesis